MLSTDVGHELFGEASDIRGRPARCEVPVVSWAVPERIRRAIAALGLVLFWREDRVLVVAVSVLDRGGREWETGPITCEERLGAREIRESRKGFAP